MPAAGKICIRVARANNSLWCQGCGEWPHRCSWLPLQLACTVYRLFAQAFRLQTDRQKDRHHNWVTYCVFRLYRWRMHKMQTTAIMVYLPHLDRKSRRIGNAGLDSVKASKLGFRFTGFGFMKIGRYKNIASVLPCSLIFNFIYFQHVIYLHLLYDYRHTRFTITLVSMPTAIL